MWWSRKKTSLGIETFQLEPSSIHSSHDQALTLEHWTPHGTVAYMFQTFTQRSKHFHHVHINALEIISITQLTTPGWSGFSVCWVWWISGHVLGDLGNEDWLYISHWVDIRTSGWAFLSRDWLTMCQNARFLSFKTSLVLGHSSSFTRPSIGRSRFSST